jgi:glycosyltransferase involved in cell wall biosynthesis
VAIPALAARRRWGIPYVADWADLWGREGIAGERHGAGGRILGLLDDRWETRLHRAADAATVISSFLERRVRELGLRPERVCRIAVGSNVDLIRPLPKEEMRHKYDVPVGAKVLVHAGFAPYDRDLLIETMKQMVGAEPTILLLLTGDESKALKHAIDREGLNHQVRVLGFLPYPRLGEILACGDVMILPLRDRSLNAARFPNRFGDYLAAGRPIATNPTGDLGDLVEREQVGIVAPGAPRAFADAILRLLDDRSACEAMGRRARGLAETRYSWSALVEPLEGFYQRLVGTRQKNGWRK